MRLQGIYFAAIVTFLVLTNAPLFFGGNLHSIFSVHIEIFVIGTESHQDNWCFPDKDITCYKIPPYGKYLSIFSYLQSTWTFLVFVKFNVYFAPYSLFSSLPLNGEFLINS